MSESTNLFNEQSNETGNQARHIPVVNSRITNITIKD
jgi:hypothetical protein